MTDERVLARLPQRPPFLWVDRIVAETDDSIEAEKYIDPSLPLFAGHFPHRPVVPGVIVVEALAQAALLLLAARGQAGEPVLARIRSARFRREVRPGDTLLLKARLTAAEAGFFTCAGRALVRGRTVCTAELVCGFRERDPNPPVAV